MPDPIRKASLARKVPTIDPILLAESESPAVWRVLGPGRYVLRSGDTGLPLSGWTGWPVSGGIHVAWTPNGVVETWVMLTQHYLPIGQSLSNNSRASVVATCVASPAGDLQSFLDSFGAAPRVICTWDTTLGSLQAGSGQTSPRVVAPRNIPGGPTTWAQCAPGEVESFRIDVGGALIGARLGTVSITGPSTGDWRMNTYTEQWRVEQPAPIALNQSALFRHLPPGGPAPSGQPIQLWSVQYQIVN